jgi:hypothetical protein
MIKDNVITIFAKAGGFEIEVAVESRNRLFGF